MRRRSLLIGVVILACLLQALAQKEKKNQRISDVITTARYVYITTAEGDPMKATASPQDRRAAADLSEYLQEWGRYKVAMRREDAELILVVSSGGAGVSARA